MDGAQSSKLNWMYEGKNSSIDHEQYLLGKRITSSVANDDEDKGDFLVKTESSVATGNVTVLERLDYESKVREDPLFQIRKNDFEHRKELLSNPLKKKRIQNMLKEALEKDLRRNGAQNDSDTTSSSEDSSDSSSTSNGNTQQRERSHKLYNDRKHGEKSYTLYKTSKREERQMESHVKDSKRKSSSRKYDSESKTTEKNRHSEESSSRRNPDGYGLICVRDGKHVSTTAKRRRQRTPSPEKPKERYQRVNRSGFSKRLTKEELDKKRNEMLSNASWRDNQRKDNVKKFRMEEAREEEKEKKLQLERKKDKYGQSRDFLHNMKLKTASSGSVEDSVKRKRHTLSHKF